MSLDFKVEFINGLESSRFNKRAKENLWRIYKEDKLSSHKVTLEEMQRDICKLNTGYPIAYLTGIQYFYDSAFEVGPGVLIPRPETEELVDLILSQTVKNHITLLDVGTGSACIPISIKLQRPKWDVWAMEKSSEALKYAKSNVNRLAPDVHVVQDDIMDPKLKYPKLDVLVSNPPYILPSEQSSVQVDVHEFEPHMALYTKNEDPLEFYRALHQFALCQLKYDGVIYMECNEFHAEEIRDWFVAKGATASLIADLQGKSRILKVTNLGSYCLDNIDK